MDVKDKIRQRRLERIRSLQMRMPGNSVFEPADPSLRYEPKSDVVPTGPHPIRQEEMTAEQVRDDDPELVWRMREREWRESWERRTNREGGGGFRFVPTRRQLWVKLLLSAVLYGLVMLLFRTDSGWAAKGERFVRTALTEDMQFDAIEAWYQKTFSGAPSFIPTFHFGAKGGADNVSAPAKSYHTPVAGKVIAPFAKGHPFAELQTAANAPVVAMDGGLVQFAGIRDGAGYTITIQHSGGYQTTYSGLKPGNWQKEQWVDAGDPLGQVASMDGKTGDLVFAVMKDRIYVDPADVVSLD